MTIVRSPLVPLVPPPGATSGYAVFRASYPTFMAEVQRHRQQRDHERAKLRALPESARHARVRKLLRDRRLHVLYAFDALRKTRQLGAATPETVRTLASEWNPFGVCREATNIFMVPGRHRERRVVSFGPHRRMHQGLVAHIIRDLHPPLESQKLFRGGMPKALAAVEAAINEGYVYGAEVDVVHFYSSVRYSNELVELLRPLPASVVEHVVWDTGVRRDPDSDFMSVSSLDDPSLNGFVGLAPGAGTSAIVGEKIMSLLLTDHRDVRFVAYADNVFVLGRQADAVATCLEHLRNNAEGLATGPLRLRDNGITHLTGNSGLAAVPAQFTFLHHVGELRDDGDATCPARLLTWSPDQRKLDEYSLADNGKIITEGEIERIERKVSEWRKAYPSWPEGDIWEMRYLAELAALRFYENAAPLNKSQATHAVILCYFAEKREREFAEFLPDGKDATANRRREQIIEAAHRRLATIETRHSPAPIAGTA